MIVGTFNSTEAGEVTGGNGANMRLPQSEECSAYTLTTISGQQHGFGKIEEPVRGHARARNGARKFAVVSITSRQVEAPTGV
jgi:hypothetical protein